jgi:hypothetical protein
MEEQPIPDSLGTPPSKPSVEDEEEKKEPS